MNSGKHQFFIAPGGQAASLVKNVFFSAASDPSAGIGDNAVAAELVAAVLHLDKGPGMVGNLANVQVLILLCPADIQNKAVFFFPILEIILQNL